MMDNRDRPRNIGYRKAVAVVAVLAIILCGCYLCLPKDDEPLSISGEVTGTDPRFGDVLVNFSTDDMLEKGFRYGDYLRIQVGDHDLKNVVFVESANCSPYFSFFVVNDGASAGISLFFGFMVTAEVGSKVVMTYEGKCEGYQHLTALKTLVTDESRYSDRMDYANFFEITGGDIAPGRLFRSYSIMRDSDVTGRSGYVDGFAEKYGIEYMIMLSYAESKVKEAPEWFKSSYGQKLVDNGSYTALNMHPADLFNTPEKVRAMFDAIIENDGPYLIFCDLGKDRTGMMSVLLQGLCGASNDEIRESYMKAFENLYLIEKGSESYRAIQELTYDRLVYLLAHPDMGGKLDLVDWTDADISGIDVASTAVAFIKGTLGLTDEQISQVREKLTTPVTTEAYTGADEGTATA